jgi:hypothetical protein
MNVLWMVVFICASIWNFFVADSLKDTEEKMGRLLFVGNAVAGCMNLAAAIWYMVK